MTWVKLAMIRCHVTFSPFANAHECELTVSKISRGVVRRFDHSLLFLMLAHAPKFSELTEVNNYGVVRIRVFSNDDQMNACGEKRSSFATYCFLLPIRELLLDDGSRCICLMSG